MVATEDRWPPVYDADDLVALIRELVQRPDIADRFYEWRRDRSTSAPNDVCQGDVVRLTSEIPVIGADGTPGVIDHNTPYWMVVGNTCDFTRPYEEERWTQFVPVVRLGGAELSQTRVEALRGYAVFRRFYLPSWSPGDDSAHHVADLTSPVTVDKKAVADHCRVEARMNRASWVLLNACLVRFLARDDGRYAP